MCKIGVEFQNICGSNGQNKREVDKSIQQNLKAKNQEKIVLNIFT